MKIAELDLIAFGPFTSRCIPFGPEDRLHVIFGRNEAGKSSALRALHALLYGIPPQTVDAFVHPYDTLRVGGRLRFSNGDEVEFIRRKGNKNTLLARDGSHLDDHILDRCLGGVTAEEFSLFWGIDQPHLVRGGQDILEGRGDLGEALFEAGTGATQLRDVRKMLEEEAASLYAARGHNRAINKAVLQLKQLRSEERNLIVSVDRWAEQDSAFVTAEREIADLSERSRMLTMQRARLERTKRVLPLLAERDSVRRAIEDLGEVVLLSEDFAPRRQEASRTLEDALSRLELATTRVRAQEAIVRELGPSPLLVSEAAAVGELHERLGSYRKALRDRPGLVARYQDELSRAKSHLRAVRPDFDSPPEALRVFVQRRARIQALAAERERIDERIDTTRRAHEAATKKHATVLSEGKQLPPIRDAAELRQAIKAAGSRGDVLVAKKKLIRDIDRVSTQRDGLLEKLGLPASLLPRIAGIVTPASTKIKRFEQRSKLIDDEERAAKLERDRIGMQLRSTDVKIERLHRKEAVPTEEDLTNARNRRDAAFALIRAQFEKGRDVSDEARELLGKGKPIELYCDTVRSADDIADRLRFEADRVAELAQLIDTKSESEHEISRLDGDQRAREAAQKSLLAEWRKEWKGVVDPAPSIDDASEWHNDFERLLSKSEELTDASDQLKELDSWIRTQIVEVRAAMSRVSASSVKSNDLDALLRAAEELRDEIEGATNARKLNSRRAAEIEAALHDSSKDQQSALDDLRTWERKWNDAIGGLVEGPLPSPDDALSAVDALANSFSSMDKAAELQSRINGIDRDGGLFRDDVAALALRLGEPLGTVDPDEAEWLNGVHNRLASASREEERRVQARLRLDELRNDEERETIAIETANAKLLGLRREASCATNEDLVIVEARSEQARQLHLDLSITEKNLIRNGDGASLPEIEAETAGTDRDSLDSQISEIDREVTEVENELTRYRDTRAAAAAELRLLGGPSAASDKAEEIASLLARLRDDTIRYCHLRLAATLLTRRIDDYRHENQAPLLRRASDLFGELTVGSFSRLEADVEDDRPVIIGCRPNGSRVRADGMSAGTRDQMFLALRLAAVEASCANGEPMPFIADDILMQFDDERTAAALHVLTKIAATTQVILFTHHSRVRDAAERLPANVAIHALDWDAGATVANIGDVTLPSALEHA